MKKIALCIAVSVSLLATAGQAMATSQTVFGIVEKVTDGEKPRVVVKTLWDSYCRDPEDHKSIDLSKRWEGCIYRLDGKEVAKDQVAAPGRLLWCHFNRQMLRVVDCYTVDEDALKKLRPAGEGALVVRVERGVAWPQERKGKVSRRSSDLWLYVNTAGKKPEVIAVSPRFNPVSYEIKSQSLTVKDGRLRGSLELTLPFAPKKREKTPAPMEARYELDLPVTGGDGTCKGTSGQYKVDAKADVKAVKASEPPKKSVAWLCLGKKGYRLTVKFADGNALAEDAAMLHGKGPIKHTPEKVDGMVDGSTIKLTFEGDNHKYRIEGVVCGDMLGGTWTDGDKSGRFYGRLLPADLVPNGKMGFHNKDLPARK
ncbi:MAG: hypothetical protein ACLFTN_03725 [Phycisphaerae bacterium]